MTPYSRIHVSFLVVAMLIWSGACYAAVQTITVAADGSGDFKTVQEAVASVPEKGAERTTIRLKPGIYQGQIVVPKAKSHLTFLGDDPATTILTYDRNVNDPIPDGQNPQYKGTGVVILGDDFAAEKLTFRNTSGDHGQALALRVDGDRAVFRNCRLSGWQDTLMVNNGRDYFRSCFLEGRVDFIYGSATAVFDDCEIHSKDGGHITAASTPADHPFGFVFLHCRLTGDPTPWRDPAPNALPPKPHVGPVHADLGRPWRPYAAVAYLRCEMGDHIAPEGWNNWGKSENEKTARYREYHNTGPGAEVTRRVPWSKPLTDEEATNYTLPNILGGTDSWNPTLPSSSATDAAANETAYRSARAHRSGRR